MPINPRRPDRKERRARPTEARHSSLAERAPSATLVVDGARIHSGVASPSGLSIRHSGMVLLPSDHLGRHMPALGSQLRASRREEQSRRPNPVIDEALSDCRRGRIVGPCSGEKPESTIAVRSSGVVIRDFIAFQAAFSGFFARQASLCRRYAKSCCRAAVVRLHRRPRPALLPSSSGLGRRPLTAKTGVRVP